MALQLRQTIPNAHPKTVLSVAFNPARRELFVGGEDGTISCWEIETGKLSSTCIGHLAWVTGLAYCKDHKVLVSVSLDGFMILWGPNGRPLQRIQVHSPIYAVAYNSRRRQIIAGLNKKVILVRFKAGDELRTASELLNPKFHVSHLHTDIVGCVSSFEGRFFSAGYDKKLVIYDSAHLADGKLVSLRTIKDAHDAGITCMSNGKDADSTWLITGSFDRCVKLWSIDGNLLHAFSNFGNPISATCYVSATQNMWISAHSTSPIVYDPKSGIDITDFVQIQDESSTRVWDQIYKHFLYVSESDEVIGVTARRMVRIWRYTKGACLTILKDHDDAIESLTFTNKDPILIFSGGEGAVIRQWERLQLNAFMYGRDVIDLKSYITGDDKKGKSLNRSRRIGFEDDHEFNIKLHEQMELLNSNTVRRLKRTLTLIGKNDHKPKQSKHIRKLIEGEDENQTNQPTKVRKQYGLMKIEFYEPLDWLICACEDSNLCKITCAIHELDILGYNEKFEFASNPDQDSNNRASGISLKHTFNNHTAPVTCFVGIKHRDKHYLVSSGWDRRLCIWNLTEGGLVDVFKSSFTGTKSQTKEELAADEIILDMAYSPELNLIAYSSADHLVYIRKFSLLGHEMTLEATLHGHFAEVTQIKWNSKSNVWISGSEDRSIRFWASDSPTCLRVFNNETIVNSLCLDLVNDCLIAGGADGTVKVYDMTRPEKVLLQVCSGHEDEVRSVIHIASRNQYLSASWDMTVRVWNAFTRKTNTIEDIYAKEREMIMETNREEGPTLSENNSASRHHKSMFDTKLNHQKFTETLQQTVKDMENVLLSKETDPFQ